MKHYFLSFSVALLSLGTGANSLSEAVGIDFDTEIVPILSKAGCNAASCHGGTAGQAGFRLSLFGGDPAFDYRTIVREFSGRRVNYLQPLQSLIIAKPTALLDHGGGEVIALEGKSANRLAKWIAEGAPRLQRRALVGIDVVPKEFVADSVPATIQLKTTAIFDDGIKRDVTSQAVYVSQNESAFVVSALGEATITTPGRHSAIVRFANRVAVVALTTPIGSVAIDIPQTATNNWIDEEIHKTLRQLRIAPGKTTNDTSFLRRLSLDLTGRLPSPSQIENFGRNEEPTKRSKLIDELLESTSYVDYWTHWLAKQLRLRKPGNDLAAANAFYDWLARQVATDAGWNHIASSLIMSEGDSHRNGVATIHRLFATPREEAEYISEVLMGVRLRCANCHNHPLDQWTQDDYHGLAAVFAGFERTRNVRFTTRGSVIHPRTGSTAQPRIPGQRFLPVNVDNRRQFSDWLTQDENPYFSKAMVGRVWKTLTGQGLVAPVDDLRITNPASHPILLDRLTHFFAKNEFQLKSLIRLICNSAVYQRASSTPKNGRIGTPAFYEHATSKPLSAEVLADAIGDVTGVPDDFQNVERAIHVVDRTTTLDRLQYLGQCKPGVSCMPKSDSARGIASSLHLMNGNLLNEKLTDTDGRLGRLLRDNVDTQDLVREFYLRALSRRPTEHELIEWTKRIDTTQADKKAEHCQDFLWALLNCHEFTNNH